MKFGKMSIEENKDDDDKMVKSESFQHFKIYFNQLSATKKLKIQNKVWKVLSITIKKNEDCIRRETTGFS